MRCDHLRREHPLISSCAPIPVTAANALLISPDPGGCAGPPSQAVLMTELSIKLAKPGSSVPNADSRRTASIGCISILSGLPGTGFAETLGGFFARCSHPLPEIPASRDGGS